MIGQIATTALVQDKVLTPHQWRIRWDWNWPLWLSLLMMIAVVAWVVTHYFREASSAGKPVRTLLVLLRLGSLTLIAMMFAQPAIEWFQMGRPRLVVLVDRSASMEIRDETGHEGDRSRLEAYQSRLTAGKESLLQTWQSSYDLEVIAFDKQIVLLDPKETSLAAEVQLLTSVGTETAATRLGDAVDFALRELSGPTPTAIVFFTDGISTRGQSLEKAAQRARALRVPLFSVAVGSPRKRPDVSIDNFLAEEVVFPGDRLQVEATIHATSFAGREATLILRDMSALRDVSADQVLAQTIVQLPVEGESLTVRLSTRSETPGQLSLQLEIKPLEGETNVENNLVSQIVEVRDEKIRVLLVQASPSYEYRALKSMLERDPAVELRVHLQEADADFSEVDEIVLAQFPAGEQGLFDFDVVLLGDVDPTLLPRQVWATLERFVAEQGGGLACIVGPRFMPQAFQGIRPMRLLLPFELEATSFLSTKTRIAEKHPIQPTALGWRMSSLQLGGTDAESRAIWRSFPAVSWLYEIDEPKPGAQILAEHATQNNRRGNRSPVILRHYVGAGEVLFHATDETWRWRWRTDDRYFARYWGQVVRRLGRGRLNANRQGIRLKTDRSKYQPGEDVKLQLRFRNPSAAPADDQGVTVQLQGKEGSTQEIRLHRHAGHRGVFETVLPRLLPGKYQGTFLMPSSGEVASNVNIEIEHPPRELSRLEVDERGLIEAAKISGGKYYTLETVSELIDDLPPPRNATIEQLPARPLWNTHAVMALFVVVLTAEWLLRRRQGML